MHALSTPPPRPRRLRDDLPVRRRVVSWRAVLAAVAVILTSSAWALALPVGASPDELHHVSYAWGTATGQTAPWKAVERRGSNGVKNDVVAIPASLILAPMSCYRLGASQPACALDVPPAGHGNDLVEVESPMARYPQPYYLATGLALRAAIAVGQGGAAAVMAARLVSGVLAIGAAVLAAVPLRHRLGLGTSATVLAVALTPMVLSLSAAVNPNGWEVALAVLVAACVASVRHDRLHSKPSPSSLITVLVISSLLLGLARPASLVWLVLLLVILVLPVRGEGLMRPWRHLGTWRASAVVLSAFPGAVWFLYANASRAGGAEGKDLTAWRSLPAWERIIAIVEHLGVMVRSGYTDLGWSEAKVPELFMVLWLAGSAAALGAFAARRDQRARSLWSGALLLGASLLVIAVDSELAAFAWQGRYLLAPLMAAAVLIAASPTEPSASPPGSARVLVLVSAVIGWLSMLTVLNRYLYGFAEVYQHFADLPVPATSRRGTWSPLLPPSVVLVLGALAALTWVVLGVAPQLANCPEDPARSR